MGKIAYTCAYCKTLVKVGETHPTRYHKAANSDDRVQAFVQAYNEAADQAANANNRAPNQDPNALNQALNDLNQVINDINQAPNPAPDPYVGINNGGRWVNFGERFDAGQRAFGEPLPERLAPDPRVPAPQEPLVEEPYVEELLPDVRITLRGYEMVVLENREMIEMQDHTVVRDPVILYEEYLRRYGAVVLAELREVCHQDILQDRRRMIPEEQKRVAYSPLHNCWFNSKGVGL